MKRKREERQRVTSYGVLLYRRDGDGGNCLGNNAKKNGGDDDDAAAQERGAAMTIRFLLGLIPQRNWWTVFKGLPRSSGEEGQRREGGEETETPHQTALREFAEETGTVDRTVLREINPELTLKGEVRTGNKDLEIYLQDGSEISADCFDVDKVVRIDRGYMEGKPEIVEIRWLTLEEALGGVASVSGGSSSSSAKVYTSQRKILRDAHEFLVEKYELRAAGAGGSGPKSQEK